MKKLFWVAVCVAAVLYSITVYRWWQEGNRNFDWQEWCSQYNNELDKTKVPSGCLPYYEAK